jgi:hypothetical protein
MQINFINFISSNHMELIATIQSLDLKLENTLNSIENNAMERLAKLDDKISAIYDKLFDKSDDPLSAVHNKLLSFERQFADINRKLEDLKVQNSIDVSDTTEPIHVNVNAIAEALGDELITSLNVVQDSVEEMNKKILQNKNLLNRNLNELTSLKVYLQTMSNNSMNSDLSQRREREILSVVKKRSRTWRTRNASSTTRPFVDKSLIEQNVTEHIANQTMAGKKGSVIFPSVKNKPSKVNTTFTVDSVGSKEFKVSIATNWINILFSVISFTGLLLHRTAKCRPEAIRCILSPNTRHNVLVFESLLRARDCRWRMDGKHMFFSSCNR